MVNYGDSNKYYSGFSNILYMDINLFLKFMIKT